MDTLAELVGEAGDLANKSYAGVFSLHRNSVCWEACMGSIHAMDSRCYPGGSMEEALRAMCVAEKNRSKEQRAR